MPRRITLAPLAAVVAAWLAPPAAAGVYSPDEPPPVRVRPDGAAEELAFGPGFEGEFALRFSALGNMADPRPEFRPGAPNEDRVKLLARTADLRRKPARSADETVALAAAELRADNPAGALNLLAPRSRDRVPDFRVLANLAAAHARRGEWDEAARWHQAALLDAEFPDDLPGATPAQRAWLKKVERDHYRRWLQAHRARAADKRPPDTDGVFPLFPVQFRNDAGVYEPGKLAAAERAKLPPNAVPVVQQLLLWAPWDTDLYWLLAELYAADGRVRAADTIFFQCANSRQYSNRAELMAHRQAVREAVARLPQEKPAEEVVLPADPPATPADYLPSAGRLAVVGTVFGLVAVALLALQARAIGRRLRRT